MNEKKVAMIEEEERGVNEKKVAMIERRRDYTWKRVGERSERKRLL